MNSFFAAECTLEMMPLQFAFQEQKDSCVLNQVGFEVKIPENSGAERDFSLHFGFQTNWVSRRAREKWQFFFMKQLSKMALEAAADAIAKREKNARTQKTNTQAAPNQRLSRRIDPGKERVSKILAAWAGPTSYPSCHLPDLEAHPYPAVITSALLALFL